MDEHTIKCDTETRRNREQVNNIKPIVPVNPKIKTRDIPSGAANSVTERNSYGLGHHNRQIDSRNQSFQICNRNKTSNTKGSDLVPYSGWLK